MERIIEYQADINGKEVKTPRDFLSYDNIDKFVIDIKDIDVDLSTARDVIVLFVCYSYDKQKHTQISCELDQENKKISFKLPENLREHQGLVKASVYMDFTNEDRLELITISFKIRKSLIDQNITEVVDYYYETFNKRTEEMTNELNKVGKRITELTNVMLEKIDGNVEEIERIRDENLDRLKNIKYDIDNFVAQKTNNVTTKTNEFLTFVDGKMQTVTSAYDNIDDFIENKNQEFATYADSKKTSINGYLTEFNTYVDSQKAGFKGVVDEQSALVQQSASDFRKNLNMEKVSFSDDINAIHDYYESQMNTVKEAFANAQTLLDPIIEEERQKLDVLIANAETSIGKNITGKIDEFNTNSLTKINEFYTNINNKLSEVNTVANNNTEEIVTFKNTASQKLDELNTYITSERTNIDLIIPQLENELDGLQTRISDMSKKINSIGTIPPSGDGTQTVDASYVNRLNTLEKIVNYYHDTSNIPSYIDFESTDTVGVIVDFPNNVIRGTTLVPLRQIKAYNRRRCNLAHDGVVLSYFGEEGYVDTGATTINITKNGKLYPAGTLVETMVEQPKFYYRVKVLEEQTLSNNTHARQINKAIYEISNNKKEGFNVHPAFMLNDIEHEYIYLSAYESGSRNGKLTSIANISPMVGLRSQHRTYANNIGDGWGLYNVQTMSLDQLLTLIEFKSFNMQSSIGAGTISTYPVYTGRTSADGNNTNLTNLSATYRGEENLYGNYWCVLDGINIEAGNHVYIANKNYKDDNNSGYTQLAFDLIGNNGNGFVSRFGYDPNLDWLFMPVETRGSSALPVGDYFYEGGSAMQKCMFFGGSFTKNNDYNGLYCYDIFSSYTQSWTDTGSRLIYSSVN